MASCPKCHTHLRMIDWKQSCPHCGANIVIYDLQERLMQDADKAEVQYYHFQKKVDRLKGAFVGSKLAIARIFTCILPLAAIFLPLIKGKISEPLVPFEGNLSAITLYNMFESLDFGVLKGLLAGETKAAATALAVAIVGLLASLVLLVVNFLCLMIACSPRCKPRGAILNGLLLAATLTSLISFALIPANGFIDAKLGIGSFLYLALVLVDVGINLYILFIKPIEITHKQCYVGGIPIEEYFELQNNGATQEELRAEMYRRLTIIQEQKEAELKAKEEAIAAEEKAKKEAVAK